MKRADYLWIALSCVLSGVLGAVSYILPQIHKALIWVAVPALPLLITAVAVWCRRTSRTLHVIVTANMEDGRVVAAIRDKVEAVATAQGQTEQSLRASVASINANIESRAVVAGVLLDRINQQTAETAARLGTTIPTSEQPPRRDRHARYGDTLLQQLEPRSEHERPNISLPRLDKRTSSREVENDQHDADGTLEPFGALWTEDEDDPTAVLNRAKLRELRSDISEAQAGEEPPSTKPSRRRTSTQLGMSVVKPSTPKGEGDGDSSE